MSAADESNSEAERLARETRDRNALFAERQEMIRKGKVKANEQDKKNPKGGKHKKK